MKWWHVAVSLGLAYIVTRSSRAEVGEEGETWGGGGGGGGGEVLIGPPKVTYGGGAPPTVLSSDLHQKLAVFFTRMYDCAKYSYDDVASGAKTCCASGRISITTAANGTITVYCVAVSGNVQPTVLLQYASLAQMYNDIGYMLPK